MLQALPVWVSLVIPGFFLAMSGVAIAAALHARQVAQAVESTKVLQTASAGTGVGAFEGKVSVPIGRSLESMLTGARCCWFHVKVEKQVRRSPDRTSTDTWTTIAEYTSRDPFLIADGTGTSAVFPDGADVTPTDRSVWYGATPFPEDRNPNRFGPGESTEGMLRIDSSPNRRFRYTEERIYDGDPLYVLGQVERVGDDEDEDDDDDFDPNRLSLAQPQYGVTPEDLTPYARDKWTKQSRYVELRRAVHDSCRLRIGRIRAGKKRFLLSTTQHDRLAAMNRGGSIAAVFIAAVPAAIAALFIWVRFFR